MAWSEEVLLRIAKKQCYFCVFRFFYIYQHNYRMEISKSRFSLTKNYTITVIYSQNLILELGQCLPKTCSAKDIFSMLKADPLAFLITSTQSTPAFSMLEIRSQDTIRNWIDYRFKVFM